MKKATQYIKLIKKTACVLLAAVMCSCVAPGITGFGVEELLRAPQPSPEQNAVQKALNAHFGETLQLKYPRFGTEMTPFIIQDFDNDGQAEAAVLYTSTAKGQNVHLAILENKSGVWEVVQEIEGLAAEVLLVDNIALYPDKANCLVVGYTSQSLNDKYLAVYTYSDETILPVFTQAYSSYTISDFDDDGLDEIIYVQTAKPSLYVVETIENELKITNNIPLDERFDSCLQVAAGEKGSIVVDGILQSTGIASTVYTLDGAQLRRIKPEEVDVFNLSKRYVPSLLSCDIDDNGTVDVPCVVKSIDTFNTTRRFYFVTWNDFTQEAHEKRYGVYDAKYNYFLRLPTAWKGEYNLIDDGTADGGWQLRGIGGYNTILTVKIAPRSFDAAFYTLAATLGEKQLLLSFGDSCSNLDAQVIKTGIKLF